MSSILEDIMYVSVIRKYETFFFFEVEMEWIIEPTRLCIDKRICNKKKRKSEELLQCLLNTIYFNHTHTKHLTSLLENNHPSIRAVKINFTDYIFE